jgi:hypothetical protein
LASAQSYVEAGQAKLAHPPSDGAQGTAGVYTSIQDVAASTLATTKAALESAQTYVAPSPHAAHPTNHSSTPAEQGTKSTLQSAKETVLPYVESAYATAKPHLDAAAGAAQPHLEKASGHASTTASSIPSAVASAVNTGTLASRPEGVQPTTAPLESGPHTLNNTVYPDQSQGPETRKIAETK